MKKLMILLMLMFTTLVLASSSTAHTVTDFDPADNFTYASWTDGGSPIANGSFWVNDADRLFNENVTGNPDYFEFGYFVTTYATQVSRLYLTNASNQCLWILAGGNMDVYGTSDQIALGDEQAMLGWNNFSFIVHHQAASMEFDFYLNGVSKGNVTCDYTGFDNISFYKDAASASWYGIDNITNIVNTPEATPPASETINLSTVLPATTSSFDFTTINFNTTINSTEDFTCRHFINTSVNATKTYSTGTNVPINFSVTFPSGEHSYSWRFDCNNSGEAINSSTNTLYIDTNDPLITDSFNGTVVIGDTFSANITFSDSFLYSYNITWDGVQFANQTNLAVSSYQYNFSINISTNASGLHTVWSRACDGHTDKYIPEWNNKIDGNKVEFDNKQISITGVGASKVTLKKALDRYSPTFEYSKTLNDKVYLLESTYKIEKVKRNNYAGWFVIPALEKWIDFEDDSNSKVTYKKINDYKWEITVENPSKKIEYNSIGELNCNNLTSYFFYAKATDSKTATSVFENQPVTYELNVTYNATYMTNITALLEYNNSNYTISPTVGTTQYVFNKIMPASNLTIDQNNNSFQWHYTIQQASANTTTGIGGGTQYIYRIRLDNCSSYSIPSMNFTIMNETSGSAIGGTSEFYIEYYLYGVNYSYSGTMPALSTPKLCIYPSFGNFSADIQIEYSATNFDGTFNYFTNNTQMDNLSSNVSLYLTEGTTQVTFTVTDENDNEVQDVFIKVLKWDVGEGLYKTVEVLKTDSSGVAIGRIVQNTVWYKFILELDGAIVLETTATKITGTEKTFRIDTSTDYFDNYNIVDGVAKSLTFNNQTKNFLLTWSDPSGDMHYGCLKVVKRTLNGDTLLNQTCVESTASTIVMNIGDNSTLGTNTYIATAFTHFEEHFIWDVLTVSFDYAWQTFGETGIWVSFLLILAMVLVGVWNPIAALVLMIVGFTAINILGFYHLNWEYLVTLIILVGIAIWKQGSDR